MSRPLFHINYLGGTLSKHHNDKGEAEHYLQYLLEVYNDDGSDRPRNYFVADITDDPHRVIRMLRDVANDLNATLEEPVK